MGKKRFLKNHHAPKENIYSERKRLFVGGVKFVIIVSEKGFSSECVQQLVQTTVSRPATHSGGRHREQKLSCKLYTWKTGLGYRPTVWSIIHYTGSGLARNSPKSITGKYRPIGLPERETEKNLNNGGKPVRRRRRR